jgi:hypothetical protein
MEEDMEIEEESSSTVAMPAARGTFIAGTADGTVTLVSPERAKNLVWFYFKKYGSKKLTRGHDNLKLQHQALSTICLGDQDRRRHSTVQLGKDNSPSSLMDHYRGQHDAVVVARF